MRDQTLVPSAAGPIEPAGTDVWCDLSDISAEETRALTSFVVHAPIDRLVLRADQLADWRPLERLPVASEVDRTEQLDGLPDWTDTAVIGDLTLADAVRRSGRRVALRQHIVDGDTLEQARSAIERVDVLLVSFKDTTNIPLELLIAEAEGARRAQVVKELADPSEAPVVAGILEHGPAGVLIRVRDLVGASVMVEQMRLRDVVRVELTEMTVVESRPVGIGYRGCIDTASLFAPDEGMLVGSTSHGGILICAEVHYLPYMNLRPFRVNAGAVHSYVYGPTNTDYLTDLQAGCPVWAVSSSGLMRRVPVGRIKTEVRPLRLVSADANGASVNVMLQDDWHVRVMGGDGTPLNLTDLRRGDKLLGRLYRPGRHVGLPVTETIDER
jgi:3-amino-4-hydroxybenzoic acid synthase